MPNYLIHAFIWDECPSPCLPSALSSPSGNPFVEIGSAFSALAAVGRVPSCTPHPYRRSSEVRISGYVPLWWNSWAPCDSWIYTAVFHRITSCIPKAIHNMPRGLIKGCMGPKTVGQSPQIGKNKNLESGSGGLLVLFQTRARSIVVSFLVVSDHSVRCRRFTPLRM